MNENRKYKYIYSLLGIMTFFCGAIWSEAILVVRNVQLSPIRTILLTLLPTLFLGGVTYLFLRYGKRNAEKEFTRMGKFYVLLGLLCWVLGMISFLICLSLANISLYFSLRYMFDTAPWYIGCLIFLCRILLKLPIYILIILLCLFRVYGIDHFKCWSWKFSFLNLIVAVTCMVLSLFLARYIILYL